MFLIHPDDSWGRLNPYEVDARHAFSLPGIRCPKCHVTWATTGVAYPTVSADVVKSLCAGIPIGPVPPEQFDSIAINITQAIGDQYPVYPGTNFGVLKGKIKGSISDFVWLNPWTPLIQKAALGGIVQRGIQFNTAEADLNIRAHNLLEIEAIPSVALHQKCLATQKPETCLTCGRKAYQVPNTIVLDVATIPKKQHVMRIKELPTMIIVSEVTARVLSELHLQNFMLTEVETSN